MSSLRKSLEIVVFILSICLCSEGICAPAAGGSARGDGAIAIYNFHENDFSEIRYRDGDRYIPEGLAEFEHIMRSRGDGSTHKMDLRLLELLDRIQDHFNAETVEVISGYRSPKYNGALIDAGRGAARESLHQQGMAADIHLDEVSEEALFDYASKLGVGGAGIYPRYSFVHVDAGPPRTWREAPAKERVIVGTENNPNPAWAALTDKNQYTPGSELSVAITNNDYGTQKLVTNVWIERFRKGKWCEQSQLSKGGSAKTLKQGDKAEWSWQVPSDQPLGKYRLVIFANKDLSVAPIYSNEFYVR